MPSQQFESHLGHHVHRAQLAYVAVDVEVAVVDLRVGLLVEEVAGLHLEVDALHLVLHLGIGKPVVAVLVGEVVVAVLGRGGEGELLRQVQVHRQAMGGGGDGACRGCTALHVALAHAAARAEDEVDLAYGRDGARTAERQAAVLHGVDDAADVLLVLSERGVGEEAQRGLPPVETLAEAGSGAVGVGMGVLLYALDDGGDPVVAVAVHDILVEAGVTEPGIGKDAREAVGIAHIGIGGECAAIEEAVHVVALEGAVVGHDGSLIDGIGVAHVAVVAHAGSARQFIARVAECQRRCHEQLHVVIVARVDAVVEVLRVEVERQGKGSLEVFVPVGVLLPQYQFVEAVPHIVLQGAARERGVAVEVALHVVYAAHEVDAVVEAEVAEPYAIARVERGGVVLRGDVLRVAGGAVDAHAKGARPVGSAHGEVETEVVVANAADGVGRVLDGELGTVEPLCHALRTAQGVRGERARHGIAVPRALHLQAVVEESLVGIPLVVCLGIEVVQVGFRCERLFRHEACVGSHEAVVHRVALAAYIVVVVGGVERELGVLVELLQMVESHRMGAVVEVAPLGQSGTGGHHRAHGAEGVEPHAAHGVLLGQLGGYVVARIVALVDGHVLAALAEVHRRGLARHERITAYVTLQLGTTTQHGVDGEGALGLGAQLEVDGHLIGNLLPLQRLDGLVVLHHLHGAHILCADVLRGQSVACVQHVHVLDVELRYVLPVVLDASALAHLHAGHALDDVGNHAVVLLLVGGHVVVDGVAAPPYLVGHDAHLLDCYRLFHGKEVEPLRAVGHHLYVLPDGHTCRRHRHRVGVEGKLHLVVPARHIHIGKAEDDALALGRYGDVGIGGLAVGTFHEAVDNRFVLGNAIQRYRRQEGDK